MDKNDLTTVDFIRELAKIIKENDLTDIEIEKDDVQIRLAKEVQVAHIAAPQIMPSMQAQPQAPLQQPAPKAENEGAESPNNANHPGVVTAPMVGIIYRKPDPDADNFVSVGSEVKEGDTLVLIEAMKVFNPIKAPRSGKVSQIFVEAGEPVEFGSPLLIIE